MGEPEKEIAQLESLLRRLEKEYDQFLAGQLRREPTETENAVLAIVRGWSARGVQNPTLTFKFNTLVARYNAFRTVWQRRVREREEGRSPIPAPRKPRAVAPAPRPAPQPAPPPGPAEYVSRDPHREGAQLHDLYTAYRRLREECGEPTERLREETFRATLSEKIEALRRAQGCDAVAVRVVAEGGRTRIVAKPVRGCRGPGPAP